MSNNLVLLDVLEEDLPVFFEHQRDLAASQMAAFQAREWEAFKAHWSMILSDDAKVKKTITFNGHVAGNILCWEQSGEREVGYWIGREYWGRGIATEALSQLLSYLKMRPLYAHVAKHNIASIRVLEKCGFMLCGEDKDFSKVGGEKVEGLIFKLGGIEGNEEE